MYQGYASAARDLKWKAREIKLQSWPSQSAVTFITRSLSWADVGIEEAPSAPIAKMH